jgi:hypothetical protein
LRLAFAAAGFENIRQRGQADIPYHAVAPRLLNACLGIYNAADWLLEHIGLGRWFGALIVSPAAESRCENVGATIKINASMTADAPLIASEQRKTAEAARLVTYAAGAITLIYVLCLWVPWRPQPMMQWGLDAAWMLALHEAFAKGWDFGRQIVFTYGPWGFICYGFHEATQRWQILAWVFLAVAFWAGAWAIFRRSTRSEWGAALWLTALATATTLSFQQYLDVRLTIFCPMLLIYHFWTDDRAMPWPKALMLGACALGGLTKFTLIVMTLIVLVPVTIDEIRRLKRWPWSLSTFLGGLLVFWLAAGQSPLAISAFVRTRLSLSSGFESAMAIEEGPIFNTQYFILAAGLSIAFVAVDAWERMRYRGLLPLAGLCACLFLVFKGGYVRHDSHEAKATAYLLAITILYCAAFDSAKRLPVGRFIGGALVASSMALAWMSLLTYAESGLPSLAAGAPLRVPSALAEAGKDLIGGSDAAFRYDRYLATLRTMADLPSVTGTVDVYPTHTMAVISHHLQWDPRPVFQSYVAYDRALLERNAAHLQGADAPESILLDIEPIDSRFPAFDDSLSWPALLGRYELADASKSFLLLRRRAQGSEPRLTPVSETTGWMNEPIAVPALAGAPLWAEIEVDLTAVGAAYAAAYRAPLLEMTIALPDSAIRYRFVPAIARAGFLLSPMIADRMSFAALTLPDWEEQLASRALKSLRISAVTSSGVSDCYKSEVHIRFSKLEFEHRDASAAPGIAEHLRLTGLSGKLQVLQASAPPVLRLRGLGGTVLAVQPPTAMGLAIAPEARTIHVGFGLLEEAQAPGRSAPVEFRLEVQNSAGQVVRIWTRTLDSSNRAEDRGIQLAEIPQPVDQARMLILETLPATPGAAGAAFWSDIQVK